MIQVFTAEAQTLPFTHYTPEREINPLPSAEVHYVYQDTIGYVWFAIYSSGLVRYNGTSMDVYGVEDGLRDLTVWEVTEDSKGRLWATSNAGLVVSEKPLTDYSTGEPVRFVTEIDGVELLDRSVNHNRMVLDSRDRLWVGTDNIGIVRYHYDGAGVFAADTVDTGVNDEGLQTPVRAVEATGDGFVWAALVQGNLLRYDPDDRIASFNSGNNLSTNSLFTDASGTLWGGDQGGRVWQMKDDDDQPVFVTIDQTLKSNISDIISDSRGNLWVSSEGEGILKIPFKSSDSETKEAIEQTNGLLGNIVFNVFEDREKNIWIAQSGGVSKLRYNYPAFKNLTAVSYSGEQPLLPGASVGSVHYAANSLFPCNSLAGTSQGGVACISDQFESESITQNDGLQNNWINGVESDKSGRIWIGTLRGLSSISFGKPAPVNGVESSKGINLYGESGVLSQYGNTASILAAENLMIDLDSSQTRSVESQWFPAYHEVYVVADDRFYNMNDRFGLPAVIYHSAAFDGDGHLWLGTRDRGIYRSTEPFSLQTLQEVTESGENVDLFEQWWSTGNGAPSNQIEKMLWTHGLMWVGTQAGLYALDAATLDKRHVITTEDGFLADNATSFDLSPVTKTLWVGTNQGLAEVNPETGKVLKTVTRLDGLVDNEVWYYGSVDIGPDGKIYYGTAKGVSIYDPAKDYQNEEPPIVVIESVLTEEEQGERNQFTFEYSALSFGNERGLQYQTRLTGFNDEWSRLKADTRINYTNLPAVFFPKEYTFEVRAINESNISSGEPARYSFFVSPPLLLEWWAFLGYLFILGLGIFSVDRFQRARLLKKEREAAHLRETELKAEAAIARSKVAEVQAKALQAENDLKVAELEKARELESAYHELKNTQNRLIQAEKMASLGRLSTGIAHEIKNPLNFINNFAEVSNELVGELKDAIKANDTDEITFILSSLSFNTEKIEEHGKRADSIVRSMMQHSRSGSSDMEKTDLNRLIKKYAELAYQGRKVQNKEIDVSVSTELDPSLQPFDLMAQKIGQVLQNLIENAIDSVWSYSKEKGDEFKPAIVIESVRFDDRVEVHIADNGPGIPKENRERIFEPFFTTKPTGEGTGLGLSISYDIITQMHNGKLEIDESDMGGALFVITLPIVQ
ncbi:sensor histidine kinase [Rhodohalobacter sp. 8-1]|uniref:sensor histidine kinase n=1 Tax=Rhodohalobacter sp. 8-1 TaxID=3131972 RepID=UPI0030EC849D